MRVGGRRQSTNVQDSRGRSGRVSRGGFGRGGGIRIPMGRSGGARQARGGGLGCGTMLVIGAAAYFIFGINPLALLGLGGGLLGGGGGGLGGGLGDLLSGGGLSNSLRPQPEIRQQQIPQKTGKRAGDEMGNFVKVVLAETEDVWNGIFKANGMKYPEPILVLFSGQVRSSCGLASSATGPFYCPGDQKIYIDLSFYNQMARDFGASGDFAYAYVLAHEVGHHIQQVTGVLPKFNQMRQRVNKRDANFMSTRVELQADCFAGIWGHYTNQKGLLDSGDLDEALNAAVQIGDDAIQKRIQGYVVPESFNHGTSKQRRYWFKKGFDTGRLQECDTFNNTKP